LCPLPQAQLAEAEFDEALEAVWSGASPLSPVVREREDGPPERMAEGYADQVPRHVEIAGQCQRWMERRLVVRSIRQAQAAEVALRARVAKAQAQVEALNQRGRGRKRFEDVPALRQAVTEIGQRYGVEACLWLRYHQHSTTCTVRAYRGGGQRGGSRPTTRPPSRSAWTKRRSRRRCAGWGGGCMAPITRLGNYRLRKRYWPIAVNISSNGAWVGSKDVPCR
jgi:hypothetical protein